MRAAARHPAGGEKGREGAKGTLGKGAFGSPGGLKGREAALNPALLPPAPTTYSGGGQFNGKKQYPKTSDMAPLASSPIARS